MLNHKVLRERLKNVKAGKFGFKIFRDCEFNPEGKV